MESNKTGVVGVIIVVAISSLPIFEKVIKLSSESCKDERTEYRSRKKSMIGSSELDTISGFLVKLSANSGRFLVFRITAVFGGTKEIKSEELSEFFTQEIILAKIKKTQNNLLMK